MKLRFGNTRPLIIGSGVLLAAASLLGVRILRDRGPSNSRLAERVEAARFFPSRDYSECRLFEKTSGGWLSLRASAEEVAHFSRSRGYTVLPSTLVNGTLTYSIQFQVPEQFVDGWSNRTIVIRGSSGPYGIHGFFDPSREFFLICLYR